MAFRTLCFLWFAFSLSSTTCAQTGHTDTIIDRQFGLTFQLSYNRNFVHKIPGDSYRAKLHRTAPGDGIKVGMNPKFKWNRLSLGLILIYSRQNYFREQYTPPELVFNRRSLLRRYDVNLSTAEIGLSAQFKLFKPVFIFGRVDKEYLLSGKYTSSFYEFGELQSMGSFGDFDPINGNSVWACTYGIGSRIFTVKNRDVSIQLWSRYNLSRRFVGPPLFDNRIRQYGLSLKYDLL
ncbi:hypothetical protein [Neolewinella persica]|uniref:hypothetical protein n=1 Tax=Neolewinella persica TaxID=70998 RepID=UPI00037D7513|nr:hypothetical protein [Neolewinella persica]